MLCQDAYFVSICIKLRHLANAIINAGFMMIQSARVGMERFAEGVRARDFPIIDVVEIVVVFIVVFVTDLVAIVVIVIVVVVIDVVVIDVVVINLQSCHNQ